MLTKRILKSVFKSKNSLRSFSKIDYEARDMEEYIEYHNRQFIDKKYLASLDNWRKPLERKLQRRERRNERLSQMEPVEEQEPKFVVHNPALPLQLPIKPYNMFAVLSLNGTQYKVPHVSNTHYSEGFRNSAWNSKNF